MSESAGRPIPQPVLAVAWLHRNKPTAYVITSRVKEIWLKVDPKMVENYTTPLYAEQPSEDKKSRLAPSPAGPDALAERLKAMIAEFGDDGYMTDCLTTILALKSDQKRLDWLIDNCPYWPLDGGNALPTVSRAAIDAAMSQQEGPHEPG